MSRILTKNILPPVTRRSFSQKGVLFLTPPGDPSHHTATSVQDDQFDDFESKAVKSHKSKLEREQTVITPSDLCETAENQLLAFLNSRYNI